MLPARWKRQYQSARHFREVQVHWRVHCGEACRGGPPVSISQDYEHGVPHAKAFFCTRHVEPTDHSTRKMTATSTVLAESNL